MGAPKPAKPVHAITKDGARRVVKDNSLRPGGATRNASGAIILVPSSGSFKLVLDQLGTGLRHVGVKAKIHQHMGIKYKCFYLLAKNSYGCHIICSVLRHLLAVNIKTD